MSDYPVSQRQHKFHIVRNLRPLHWLSCHFRQDPALYCSMLLAAASALIITPNAAYLQYLDLRTLAMLWALMLVVAGLRQAGFLDYLAVKLLAWAGSTRKMAAVMTGICFFCSMLITNDVALLTFVPFTIILLTNTDNKKLLIPLIVLETIAANLGSSLTPLGNPQNLYLYSSSQMSLGSFLDIMVKPVAISFVLLAVSLFFIKDKPIATAVSSIEKPNRRQMLFWSGLMLVCLLSVVQVLPYAGALIIVLLGVLFYQRKILAAVDYSLLLTFVFLFIFIGNLQNIPGVSSLLGELIQDHELSAGILLSQAISNVPAAMLLSGFTDNYPSLILGVNLGGLGTLIASMASLISFKAYCSDQDSCPGKYILVFTIFNAAFLLVLWLLVLLFPAV